MSGERQQQRETRRVGGERRRGDAVRIADAITRRGRIVLRVHGTSMLPWVRPGDIAVIRRAESGVVRFGDVVLFRNEKSLFVHRIVRKKSSLNEDHFYVKGDAHPTDDGQINERELLGRVVRIYRNGKRIDLDAPSSLMMGLLIAQMSLWSKFWYPVARAAFYATRPMRRLLAMIP